MSAPSKYYSLCSSYLVLCRLSQLSECEWVKIKILNFEQIYEPGLAGRRSGLLLTLKAGYVKLTNKEAIQQRREKEIKWTDKSCIGHLGLPRKKAGRVQATAARSKPGKLGS
jgi:hypothetical protein